LNNPAKTSLKVLIVDDDQEMLLALKEGLEKYDETFSVLMAGDGMIAVEKLKHNTISLVVTDLKMPLMDGYEATRQIRSFNRDVIIIAQTAYGFADDRERALAAGCNDYVSKPVKSNDLIVMINKHLKERV